MLEIVLVIAGILILSGFFSGVEAALVSISDAEVETMVHEKRMGAHILHTVNRHLNRSVITIVVFNNLVNIVGSIVVGQMVISLYGDAVLAVITTGLTFGIIIFSEIIPKSVGLHYAERVALGTAPIILVLTTILYPVIVALEYVTNLFQRGERKIGTEAQIRSLVTLGRKAGHIETDEGQLIHRAFILNDKTAESIMTPLKDIESVSDQTTIREAADVVFRCTYSRYPVFGTSMHDVEGLVRSHDVLEAMIEGKDEELITTVIREILVVPAHRKADKLIAIFRDKNIHLAVVQKHGKTVGLITLEDVLEELVGEIEDETDVED